MAAAARINACSVAAWCTMAAATTTQMIARYTPAVPSGSAPADTKNHVPAGASANETSVAVTTAGMARGGSDNPRSAARSAASASTHTNSTAANSSGCAAPLARKPPHRIPMMAPLKPARPSRHSERE